ncbi:MAG: alanine racemase, partial [Muribaculaceae bacterium]|nr:alanine racemase [Muribaculaceae bacterium]
MSYTLNDIASILGICKTVNGSDAITTLLTDSRSLSNPGDTLFFAITTDTGDGHRYIRQLYDRGVRHFVVDHIPADVADIIDADFLVVSDPVEALQKIATVHREQFDIPVIGITGSAGKTYVKEWLFLLLRDTFDIVRSPRSYNSQIGVPLSIWEMNRGTNLAIIEAGISQTGEMAVLERIIQPTIGVFTNLGDEHDGGFASQEEKAGEKAKLLKECQSIVYNADDPVIVRAIQDSGYLGNSFTWSTENPQATVCVNNIEHQNGVTIIGYRYADREYSYRLPFAGSIEINNSIQCLAVMLLLGIAPDVIAERISRLTPVDTRLDVIEGVNNCLIISDSYTADFHSLSPALDFMARHDNHSLAKTIILSDLMHEATGQAEVYAAVARMLKCRGVERVIGIGEEISAYSGLFDGDACFFKSTAEFISNLGPDDFSSQLILIKGAPEFDFPLILEMLEGRRHETVLHVNLDNLVHNYNFYRARLKPSTGIVCMVKASGYGAGSYELAKTLQAQGAAYLAVAVLDEGVDLRNAGITMPIMVLNPKVDNYKALFNNRLEPEIYSFGMLQRIISEARRYGITNYPVHIKLDTGMHRLGFIESEMPELLEMLTSQNAVSPRSIFSHLCAADDPMQDEYTRMQLEI